MRIARSGRILAFPPLIIYCPCGLACQIRARCAPGGASFPVVPEFCPGQITQGIRDDALPLIGRVQVDHGRPGGAVTHPLHQLAQVRAGRRQDVANMTKIVKVQVRRAERSPSRASSVLPDDGPPGTYSAARPTCAAAAEPGPSPSGGSAANCLACRRQDHLDGRVGHYRQVRVDSSGRVPTRARVESR
jgi:hypothetical protein